MGGAGFAGLAPTNRGPQLVATVDPTRGAPRSSIGGAAWGPQLVAARPSNGRAGGGVEDAGPAPCGGLGRCVGPSVSPWRQSVGSPVFLNVKFMKIKRIWDIAKFGVFQHHKSSCVIVYF